MELPLNLKKVHEYGKKVLLESGYDFGLLDARVILCHCLDITPEYLFTHGEERQLTPEEIKKYETGLKLRLAHYPVAYIIGRREFMGLDFKVDEAVLIPRPATETLVEEGLRVLEDISEPRVIEVGAGSGNIAISLAYYNTRAKILSIDISGESLDVARENLENISARFPGKKIKSRVVFIQGDMFKDIPAGFHNETHLLVSNPPYVTAEEWEGLMEGVRFYEPRQALVPIKGAREIYEEIAEESLAFIRKGGYIIVEVGATQGEMVREIFKKNNYEQVEIKKDLEGHDRIVAGRNL